MKRVGILGLPQSGKSTLFEILMQGAGTHHGPAHEQVGVVRVPDERVDRLSALFQPKKTTYAQVQFVDSAAAGHASARAAAKGPDLFLSVRNCDAFLAVVRDFESLAVAAAGGVDAARDLRDLQAEFILNDLGIVEARLERVAKELRVGKKEHEREHAALERVRTLLEAERPLRAESFDAEEEKLLRGFQLLSRKPLLVVYNQDEASTRVPPPGGSGTLALALKAHTEREIVALPPEERAAFRAELGVTGDGLSLMIRACYELLGLISFFTVGPDEVRAWTLHRGEKAVDAAAEIHTDLAKGFIRAEVIAWDRLLEAGGTAKAREKAWLRLEGRDYLVQDGDCIEIRFNK
ncbi:MAG: redox-regulated ATPase YchF [Candidatus Eisenbacteria bacterium]|nr:redox-regulated ATPase YchF [Candidatus Eisenbacteria bacterium]